MTSTKHSKTRRRLLASHRQPLHYCILNSYSHDSSPTLTRAQSFSTASSMSSWCPILWTPNFSSSREVSWSRSRPDKCHSETGYWCKGASKPGHNRAGCNDRQRGVIKSHTCRDRVPQREQGRLTERRAKNKMKKACGPFWRLHDIRMKNEGYFYMSSASASSLFQK